MKELIKKLVVLPVLAASTLITACALESVAEHRIGQVLVCHKNKTIHVSNADYQRHIEHNDSVGPCPEGG